MSDTPVSSLRQIRRDVSIASDASSKATESSAERMARRLLVLEATKTNTSTMSSTAAAVALASNSSSRTSAVKRPADWSEQSHSAKRQALAEGTNTGLIDDTGLPKAKVANVSVHSQLVLSHEQQEILSLINTGKNLFFTGSAGTGKSVLLRHAIAALKKRYARSQDAVAITASTGLAACNVGGITLHSFAGVGLGEGTAEHLAKKVRGNKKATTRWLRTQVLVIDEISMVDGAFFDKLARVACLVRRTTKPFGGIQLVMCGDFFQLPPVTKGQGSPNYTFEAVMWNDCVDRTFNLTTVFRQSNPEFVNMLNECRHGKVQPKSAAKFQSLTRAIKTDDGIEATELFAIRDQVEKANTRRLLSLPGKPENFKAGDTGSAEPAQREKLLSSMMAPPLLTLKVDAQVMLIKNIDDTLVNGTVGKVIGFYDHTSILYREHEQIEDKKAPRKDEKSAPTPLKKEDKVMASMGQTQFPLVRFSLANGQHREVLVTAESWTVESPDSVTPLAARTQLPLILAWAMSIHKSQGQTIPFVKVDLSKVFEKGQAYVALSRATCLEGLQVLGFNPSKVLANQKVIDWTKQLETVKGREHGN